MAKEKVITRVAIVHLIGGQAKPGTTLASYGINMAEFTRQFNDKTKDRMGEVVPVQITAYSDKSFKFIIKTTPVSVLLKKAAKVEKAGHNQLTDNVATISKEEAMKIAKYKMPDLAVYDEEAALRCVAGTAKQMGIKIQGVDLSPNKTAKEGKK